MQLTPEHENKPRTCESCIFKAKSPYTLEGQISSEKYQSFVVCADSVESAALTLSATSENQQENEPAHFLLTTVNTTSIKLYQPVPCPESLKNQFPYNQNPWLWSDKPFSVLWQQPSMNSDDSALPISIDSKPEQSDLLCINRGGCDDWGDDSPFRRPGRPPLTGTDFSITLLPLMRLPWSWNRILPLNRWQDWLLGVQDESAGIIIAVRFNDSSPIYLQVSQAEFQQLSQHLTQPRQLLHWLAPKLSGRESFINALLDLQSHQPTLSKQARKAITRQIAALLEWPDAQFSLEFELSQLLQASTGPEAGILQAPGKFMPKNLFNKAAGKNGGRGNTAGHSQTDGTSKQSDQKDSKEGDNNDQKDKDDPPVATLRDPEASGIHEAIITFVGTTNTGKSTLANNLLKGSFFKVKDTETELEEDVIIIPDPEQPSYRLRVRSLPGYSGDPQEWCDKHPISSTEVVIFVIQNTLSEYDADDVLKALLHRGLPPGQILFVRNKFDSALQSELDKRQVKYPDENELKQIIKDCKKDLKREFHAALRRYGLRARNDPYKPELYFTSNIDRYGRDNELLFQAIKSLLMNLWKNKPESLVTTRFYDIRSTAEHELRENARYFQEVLTGSEKEVGLAVLTRISELNSYPVQETGQQLALLKKVFARKHHFDYEVEVTRLRELTTWDCSVANNIEKHAAALSKMRKEERKAYIHQLQEKAGEQQQGLPENRLKEVLDFSAALKASQYIKQFRETLQENIRKTLWFYEKYDADEQLKIFQQVFTRAIEAELTMARVRRILRAVGAQHLPDEVTVAESSFTEKLQEAQKELVERFSKVLLEEILMRRLYNVSQIDGDETENNEGTKNRTDSDTRPEPSVPVEPPLINSPRHTTSVNAPLPEPATAQSDTLVEDSNQVTVHCANGFSRSYQIAEAPQALPQPIVAAALTAFSNLPGRDTSHKTSAAEVTLQISSQSASTSYWYQTKSVIPDTATGTSKMTILADQVSAILTSPGVEQGIGRFLTGLYFKRETAGLIDMLVSAVKLFAPHPFAPRTFVYHAPDSEEPFRQTVLINRQATTNLGHLIILQNSPNDEAQEILRGQKVVSENADGLTPAQLIQLVTRLTQGLQALASKGLYLDSPDIAHIGIDQSTLEPYLSEPNILRFSQPDEISRQALEYLSREQRPPTLDSSETPETLTVKWLGQVFALLSAKAPVFYAKRVLARLLLLGDDPLLREVEAFDESQLKHYISDILIRDGLKKWGSFREVHRDLKAEQNLLLLARTMVRENARKRPSLDKVVENLHKLLTPE